MPCLSVFHFSSLLLYMKLWSTFQGCLSTLYLYFSPSPIPFLSLPFILCFKSVLFSSFPLCHLFVEIETHSHVQLPTVPEIYPISPSRMEHSVYTGRNLVSTNNKTYHWVSWPSLSIVRTSHSAACTPTACGVPERTVDLYTLSSWQYDWCFIAPPDNVILDKDIGGGGGGGGAIVQGPPACTSPLPHSYLKLHCKNKRVVLTQLGYLSCSFTAKECTYKQISWPLLVSSFRQSGKQLSQVPRVIVTGSYVARAMLECNCICNKSVASGKVQVSQRKRDVSLKLETYMMTIQYRTSK